MSIKWGECQWPDCHQFCHEPCEPEYEPLRFPDRPVYPVKPASFDGEQGRITPWQNFTRSFWQRLRDHYEFARWVAGGFK